MPSACPAGPAESGSGQLQTRPAGREAVPLADLETPMAGRGVSVPTIAANPVRLGLTGRAAALAPTVESSPLDPAESSAASAS